MSVALTRSAVGKVPEPRLALVARPPEGVLGAVAHARRRVAERVQRADVVAVAGWNAIIESLRVVRARQMYKIGFSIIVSSNSGRPTYVWLPPPNLNDGAKLKEQFSRYLG